MRVRAGLFAVGAAFLAACESGPTEPEGPITYDVVITQSIDWFTGEMRNGENVFKPITCAPVQRTATIDVTGSTIQGEFTGPFMETCHYTDVHGNEVFIPMAEKAIIYEGTLTADGRARVGIAPGPGNAARFPSGEFKGGYDAESFVWTNSNDGTFHRNHVTTITAVAKKR